MSDKNLNNTPVELLTFLQGVYMASKLAEKGLRSPDDLKYADEPCACMPPEILAYLDAKKRKVCANPGCAKASQGGPCAVRMFRNAKKCPIIHGVEMDYCSHECLRADREKSNKQNPKMETVDFTGQMVTPEPTGAVRSNGESK
jgi:hypothetical protein